jgi:predicted RNase H-like HicB family nuclease
MTARCSTHSAGSARALRYTLVEVFVEHDSVEKAWVTNVPALDHLSSFGSTRDEALANTREATLGYLEAAEPDRRLSVKRCRRRRVRHARSAASRKKACAGF